MRHHANAMPKIPRPGPRIGPVAAKFQRTGANCPSHDRQGWLVLAGEFTPFQSGRNLVARSGNVNAIPQAPEKPTGPPAQRNRRIRYRTDSRRRDASPFRCDRGTRDSLLSGARWQHPSFLCTASRGISIPLTTPVRQGNLRDERSRKTEGQNAPMFPFPVHRILTPDRLLVFLG